MVQMTEAAAEYDFPDDLVEAEQAYQDLVFEVQDIQEQLGNRNRDRTNAEGERMTEQEYWDWRHRAAGALKHRLDELRALKAHVRDLKVDRARPVGPSALPIVNSLVLAYRHGQSDDVAALLAQLADAWEIRGIPLAVRP